jgi:hypothetical protein
MPRAGENGNRCRARKYAKHGRREKIRGGLKLLAKKNKKRMARIGNQSGLACESSWDETEACAG